jgi:deazaflavin-dependent oxidoreductase (nitroreductase family)
MGDADNLFGDEHVRRYRETGGKVGHLWRQGSTILLLTTTGSKTGEKRTSPLIYAKDGANYVIIASKGGAPDHPGWYKNLEKTPVVELQVEGRGLPGPGTHRPRRGARAPVAQGQRGLAGTTTTTRRRPRARSRSSSSSASRRPAEGSRYCGGTVGAHVDTPAPTISNGSVSRLVVVCPVGWYWKTSVVPPGPMKSQKSPPQKANARLELDGA